MKFRIISDLHTEFWGHNGDKKLLRILENVLPPLESDKESTLLLAGDTFTYEKRKDVQPVLRYLNERFLNVLAITGNHEYYGGEFEEADDFFGSWDVDSELLAYTGDVEVVGATLWTDLNGANPINVFNAQFGMNDYKCIHNFTPERSMELHHSAMAHLEYHVTPGSVVMTHHAPSPKSIHSKYWNNDNYAYFSDMEEFILRKKPALWVHGHTHHTFDYMIGETRVVCNPVGYRGHEVTGYRKNLVIEL